MCNLVVANASTPQALTGWDTKFGVQIASTTVDLSSDDAGVDTSKPGKLVNVVSAVLGEVVAVAYERAVFLVKVKSKSSTLASVLGAASKDKNALAIAMPAQPNASTEWVNVLATDQIDSESWTQQVCSEDAIEQQLIAELSDVSTHAKFTKKFNEVTKKLRKAGSELSYRFILAVTKRCVDLAAELTPWEPLKMLISSKRISARAVPSLLPMLMKHRQYELLELAILHFTDMDERSIVRLLKFFIRQSQDKALLQYVASTRGTKTTGKRTKAATAAHNDNAEVSACERFVVALLALPTNTVFLHRAIQSLELNEVLFLLAVCNKFVYALLATPSSAAATSAETPSKKQKSSKAAATASDEVSPLFALVHNTSLYLTALPTSNQFCTWISAMLDAHVTPLIVAASGNAKLAASLEQLETVVRGHLQSCEQYEIVQSVLGNFLSSVKMPAAHGIPDYSIEELCI